MSVSMRLLAGTVLFAIAAFTLLPVPHPSLTIVGLLATEWGHVLALVALVVLWPGWRYTADGRLGGWLAIAASALMIVPTLRAIPVAGDLPRRLETAFGSASASAFCGAPPRASGLQLAGALFGIRPRPAVAEELTYAVRDGVSLLVRIQRSTATDCSAPNPGVIVVQGPTWDRDSGDSFNALGDYLAARGYGVVTIGHRPAPRWHHPAQSDDVSVAIAYVKANAERLAIDPNRLVVLGRSMQGYLALHAAYRGTGAVRGVVALYPPSDVREAYDSTTPVAAHTRETLEAYLGGTPDETPAAYDQASVINIARAGSPATLLIHGDRDGTFAVQQSVRLDDQLERAGARHLLIRLPWAIDECDFNLSGPCGQISTYAIERFLAAILRS